MEQDSEDAQGNMLFSSVSRSNMQPGLVVHGQPRQKTLINIAAFLSLLPTRGVPTEIQRAEEERRGN